MDLVEQDYREPSALSVLSFGIKFLLILNCHVELVGPSGTLCRTDPALADFKSDQEVARCVRIVGHVLLKFGFQQMYAEDESVHDFLKLLNLTDSQKRDIFWYEGYILEQMGNLHSWNLESNGSD